jgi:prepilin-type N-terminal cleavage/methylation domain-containing protein
MSNRQRQRRGLSLLEVIISIAILGGALVAIGELIRIGARNAANARDMTTAQLLCETRLSEMAAGVLDPLAGGSEMLDESGEWLCSVTSEPIDDSGLISISVFVTQNPDQFARPVSFSLTRWIVDPEVEAAANLTDIEMAALQKVAAQQGDQPTGMVQALPTAGTSGLGGGGSNQGRGNQSGGQGGNSPGGQDSPGGFPGLPGGSAGPGRLPIPGGFGNPDGGGQDGSDRPPGGRPGMSRPGGGLPGGGRGFGEQGRGSTRPGNNQGGFGQGGTRGR